MGRDRTSYTFSMSLPPKEGKFLRKLIDINSHGWQSRMFLRLIREFYGNINEMDDIDLEINVRKSKIYELQIQRDLIEDELRKCAIEIAEFQETKNKAKEKKRRLESWQDNNIF